MDDIESIKAYHEQVRRDIQKKLDELAASLTASEAERRSQKEGKTARTEWERRHARMERLFQNAERLGRKWWEEDRRNRLAGF